MRKIEQAVQDAIANGTDLDKQNTQVWHRPNGSYKVTLHRNDIIHYDADTNTITVDSCGWRTGTTRSRMNAVLRMYGYAVSFTGGATKLSRNSDHSSINVVVIR